LSETIVSSKKEIAVMSGLRRAIPRCIFVTGLLLILHPSTFAQEAAAISNPQPEQSTKPTLDKILLKLEDNFLRYRSSIPSFFCDEHVVSGMQQNGMPLFVTLTDSIFRLKRSDHDNQTRLAESREIKTVDHKPSKDAQILKGPAIFSGAFSNATAIVTFDEKACYTYHLTTSLSDHRYVIEYATKAAKDRDKHCLMQESSTGRAFIDPLTMQIERIECRTPNHPLPGTRALWTWSIDYGKVLLNGKTFWLPKKITAEVAGYSTPVEWSFDATYRNYHELTVTSRIVP
jgi:hypothetical protein